MNSQKQFNFDSLHKAFDVSILTEYTYNEIKKALAHYMMTSPKTFNDACDPARVQELIKLLNSGVALSAAYAYLKKNDYSRVQNVFDASTYIRTEVNAYKVGNSQLQYEFTNVDTEEEVKKTIFTPGGVCADNPDSIPRIAQIFRTVAASVCTTGQEIKKKGVDISGVPYTTNPAIAALAAATIQMKGVEEDVMAAGLKALMSDEKRTAICKNLCLAMEPHVPQEVVVKNIERQDPITGKVIITQKKIKAPLVSYTKGDEAKWNRQYIEASMTPRNYITLLEKHSTALSRKGQGKWACDSWTGVPLGSLRPIISHKITLDDAGVLPGSSIFVDTSNGLLVDFLRANYGYKVIGRGSKYPMLPDKDLRGRLFDYCYYPEPIKSSLSGDMTKARLSARANAEKKFSLEVHGKCIAYMSPLYFMFPEYEGLFFEGPQKSSLKYEKVPTIVSAPKIVATHKWEPLQGEKEAEKDPQGADTVWYPPYFSNECKAVELECISKFRASHEEKYKDLSKDLTEEEIKLVMADFRYDAGYSAMMTRITSLIAASSEHTVSGKLRVIRDYEEVMIAPDSFERIKAQVSVGIQSFKSLLLYNQSATSVSVRAVLSQCLAYSKHALRCNWKLTPLHNRVYSINRIVKRLALGFNDIGDCYEVIYSHGLYEELLNDNPRYLGKEVPAPPDFAPEKEKGNEEDDGEEGGDQLEDEYLGDELNALAAMVGPVQ